MYTCIHVNERCRRKSKQGQTNNKAKQHSMYTLYSYMYGYYNVSFGFYTTRDVSYVYILLPTVAKLRHMEIFGEKICNIILNGVINMWLPIRCDQETSQLILLELRLHTHTQRADSREANWWSVLSDYEQEQKEQKEHPQNQTHIPGVVFPEVLKVSGKHSLQEFHLVLLPVLIRLVVLTARHLHLSLSLFLSS